MPYKIERLKPIYLFIIITAICTLFFISEKTVFSLITKKNEEIAVGDETEPINVNETIDYPFEVVWDDKDYEGNRPSSVTYNLYNALDENTIVSTVTLTSSNVDSNDRNKWNGIFNSVRKYNDDESEAKYILKQGDLINYFQRYDMTQYQSLCMEFGDTNFANDDAVLFFHVKTDNSVRTNNVFYHENEVKNKTICVPKGKIMIFANEEGNRDFNSENSTGVVLDIKKIYPSKTPINYEFSGVDYNKMENYYGDDYPKIIKDISVVNYYYEPSKNNFLNSNLIINHYNENTIDISFDKYWNDEGFEEYRPNESTFYLYRKNDLNNVVKTINLNTNNIDPSDTTHWIGTFNNVLKYDENGNEIQYVVREKKIPNYIHSYDSNEGLVIKFNENCDDVYYSAFKIYYKLGDYYYNIDVQSQSIGSFLKNKSLVITPDSDMISSSIRHTGDYFHDPSFNVLYLSYAHSVEEYVFNKYPESNHPFPAGEMDIWHYSYSLGNHSQELYMEFRGDSWGGGYGIKIDSITTYGNETVIKSTFNLKDVVIEKEWRDEGHESERPTLTRINLKNPNTMELVDTIELNQSNKVEDNVWKKTIQLPKYDSAFQEINYFAEEESISKYLTLYDIVDIDYYNGLAVTFSDDTSMAINIGINRSDSDVEYLRRMSYSFDSYRPNETNGNYLKGYTIVIPSKTISLVMPFYLQRGDFKLKITNIKPAHYDNYASGNDRLYNVFVLKKATFNDYLDTSEYDMSSNYYYVWDYEWTGSPTPFENGTKVINIYNNQNYEFIKSWEDEGFENSRPNSIRFNLYNEKDENTIVASTVLTSSNVDSEKSNQWNGAFNNVPIYDYNGKIKYILKEELLDKYKTEYRDEYNSICIKFGDNVFNGATNKSIQFYVRKPDDLTRYYMLHNENNPIGIAQNYPPFYLSDLKNKEVCLPVAGDVNEFVIAGNTTDLDIESIYQGYKDNYYFTNISASSLSPLVEFKNDELPNITENKLIHYVLESDNFGGKKIITNIANMREEGYVKEFNDTDYEYNRPKELVFGLYVDGDPIPREMTTLHTSTCINNRCNIEFKYVRDKDSDGNPINYTIKEISDYGYTVTYEDDKVINTANPVDIKFIKEDINGKPLRGAKLAIYNKSGDKLKEFTSSNREIIIKLIPSEYTIKELEAPEGYERSNDINFIVNDDGTLTINGNTENTVKIVNETIKEKYSINLKKTLKSNEIKEFEFEISIVDFDGTLEYTGNRSGTLTFTNNKATIKLGGNEEVTIKDIPVNSKYEIRELTQDYLLTIVGDSSGILNRNERVEFINVPKEQRGDGDIVIPEEEDVPTPITGILNIASYIAGVLLLIGSIFLIVYSKKQINKKEI